MVIEDRYQDLTGSRRVVSLFLVIWISGVTSITGHVFWFKVLHALCVEALIHDTWVRLFYILLV